MTRKQQQMIIDQFEAEKCLHPASTDNLRLMITDNSPDPRPTPGHFRWYKCENPGGCPGGGVWAHGIDWCITDETDDQDGSDSVSEGRPVMDFES